jgi:hypothetical protein
MYSQGIKQHQRQQQRQHQRQHQQPTRREIDIGVRGNCGASFFSFLVFVLLFVLYSVSSDAFATIIHYQQQPRLSSVYRLHFQYPVYYHQKHCNNHVTNNIRDMSQQAPQHTHSNNLRHRFPMHTKAKYKSDDDTDDDNHSSSHHHHQDSHNNNIGKAAPTSLNGSGSDGTLPPAIPNHSRPRKNSHSNIEKSLAIKRTKQLQQENDQLKQTIQQLRKENRKLQQQQQYTSQHPKVVVERFEGEKLKKKNSNKKTSNDIENGSSSSHILETEMEDMWCDEPNLEDGTCPIEPDLAFCDALRDRAVWLVSLLILQSISGIILYKNELVLSNHPSSTYRYVFATVS